MNRTQFEIIALENGESITFQQKERFFNVVKNNNIHSKFARLEFYRLLNIPFFVIFDYQESSIYISPLQYCDEKQSKAISFFCYCIYQNVQSHLRTKFLIDNEPLIKLFNEEVKIIKPKDIYQTFKDLKSQCVMALQTLKIEKLGRRINRIMKVEQEKSILSNADKQSYLFEFGEGGTFKI